MKQFEEKQECLKGMSLQEMSLQESMSVTGGYWGILIPIAMYLFDNKDRVLEGAKDGVNDVKNLLF